MRRTFGLLLLILMLQLSAFVFEVSAHPATGIVVDRQGRIYFSDLETVWRLDAGGRLTVLRAGVSGRHVHQLTIDEDGNIYGADISYMPEAQKWLQAVWRMSPAGEQTWLVAPTENVPRGFSIHRDRAGNTYFVEQNDHTKRETLLLKRTVSGEVMTVAGGAFGHADGRGKEAKFSSVGGIAFARDGSLYMADTTSLRRVSPDGAVRTVATNLDVGGKDDTKMSGGSYAMLMGIAVDASENVYVADHGNRRILKIAPDGKFARALSAEPPWSPTGVAVAPDGSVLALEIGFTPPAAYSGPRVRRLAPDGTVTTLANVGAKEKAATQMTSGLSAIAPASALEAANDNKENLEKVESGVNLYFGLGLLAIGAVAGFCAYLRR